MEAILASAGPESLDAATVDRWRELAELRENPFLTPEWCSAWLETHPGEDPFLVLWTPGGELRGVLPLVAVRRGGVRLLRFAGARRGDWFEPACRRDDEPAMAAACAELLATERRRWQLLRLDRIDRASVWPEALWGAGETLAPARPRRTDVLPFISFGDDGWDAYLAGRSRNFRSQLGRRRRKLEREHGLDFRLTEDQAALEADFDVFLALHEERWSRRGGSSSGAEDAKRFQRRFAAEALRRGWLRLWIAEADGAPAAAWYGWRVGGRYCYALSGLAERFEPLGLGTVLLAHTIERAAAEGASVYDLMWGDEKYKRRFETGRREAATWVLGRRRHPARFAAAARTRLEAGARSLRGG
ncbi:MAG TPA: GNAT family N-acetyltransferase [Solirubrobacterales bacterium]|nr:GNAT family N-acetyltransferase [Solirubrobacterales bacterium]